MDTPDLQKLVLDLLATGLSQTELAVLAECKSHTISRYASGVRGKCRPSYQRVTCLLALHKKLCSKKSKSKKSPSKVAASLAD